MVDFGYQGNGNMQIKTNAVEYFNNVSFTKCQFFAAFKVNFFFLYFKKKTLSVVSCLIKIFLPFRSASQTRFIQNRIQVIEKHFGEICTALALYTRKIAGLVD